MSFSSLTRGIGNEQCRTFPLSLPLFYYLLLLFFLFSFFSYFLPTFLPTSSLCGCGSNTGSHAHEASTLPLSYLPTPCPWFFPSLSPSFPFDFFSLSVIFSPIIFLPHFIRLFICIPYYVYVHMCLGVGMLASAGVCIGQRLTSRCLSQSRLYLIS